MLSGETARGRYPVEALSMMVRICSTFDELLLENQRPRLEPRPGLLIDDAIAHAAAETADLVGARLIVAYTESGHTARLVAKYRPAVETVAICPRVGVSRSLALVWGVRAFEGPSVQNVDDLPDHIETLCARRKLAGPGDLVVITAGAPLAVAGVTNLLRVYRLEGRSPAP
jgi:pyruvate kinase